MNVLRRLLILTAILSVSLSFFSPSARAQSNAVRARVTQAVDMQNLVTLRGNVHPWARAEFDQGVAPDDLPMERILLVLQRAPEQEATLRQMLDAQQVKSSAMFHQWLTPEQFGRQFGPADSDLQAVTDWLTKQGFQVTKVAAGRTVIEFSGTAGLVRQVLGTEIHKFRVQGEDHWANTSDPRIPAALAPVVAGFASLNNFPRKPTLKSRGTFTRPKPNGKAQPTFTFPVPCSNGTGTCIAVTVGPGDFATIYNILPLWTAATPVDGTGQTVAVVGETNINIQDVREFRSMFGLPAKDPNIILNGPDPGITSMGEEGEADLDVEWSGAVAKGAQIDFVVSQSTEATVGTDLSALYIIDNNLAPVMSESYSSCEAALGTSGNVFDNILWEQAAAQGITVLMSTGDAGSAGCDSTQLGEIAANYGLAVSGLASTPFDVAVGGTDLNFDQNNFNSYWSSTNSGTYQTSAKSYIPENTWNYSCVSSGSLAGCTPPPSTTDLDAGSYLSAGGGGPSGCITPTYTNTGVGFTCNGGYSKPSWQSGTGVPNDGVRDIPDVSLLATDYVMCQMDANPTNQGSCDLTSAYPNLDFQIVGGTSASVQVFAGIMALVNQAHGRQGNANYVLYPMAAAAAKNSTDCASTSSVLTNAKCIFYDIQSGNNSVICVGGSPNCSNTSTASDQYGALVSNGAFAYPAATGFDLATGLGSFNVANLVNNWTSNFTPTTTTLTPNPATTPVTLTHGQPFSFKISVAPTSGSGNPTGDVSLIPQTSDSQNISPTTGIGPFTLSGGSVSSSTFMLPGGSYNVIAHYPGDGTFAAGDSSPVAVTVGQESSSTLVRLVTMSSTGQLVYNTTATTLAYGVPYYLRMDVTNSSGNSCAPPNADGLQYSIAYPCPTGGLTLTPTPPTKVPPPAPPPEATP